MEQAINNN